MEEFCFISDYQIKTGLPSVEIKYYKILETKL
jgi:hypothetical protein